MSDKSSKKRMFAVAPRLLKRALAAVTATVALTSLGIAPPAMGQARDLVDKITTPLVDPLLARPPRLDTGTILPGDDDIQPCPVAYDPATPLTLPIAVDLALCNDPQVKSAWASIKVQSAELGEARAGYLPTLNGGFSRVNDHTSFPNSNFESSTVKSNTLFSNFSWRLFDFGGRNANNRSAAALLDAALAGHDAALQKTLNSVISAYFDVQTALATVQARQKSEELSQLTVAAAQRREQHGEGAQSDTLQAMTALAKARLGSSRAEGDYEKAESILIYTVGLPANTKLDLVEDVEDPVDSIHEDLDTWLTQAEMHHPAIIAAQAQLTSARERVIATRSEGLPTVDLTANFYRNGRPDQSLSPTSTHETLVNLTLNIPIFDGFSTTYKVRGAQAQVELKEADLRETERQTLMDVVKAHADATMSLANLDASQKLLDAAHAAVDTVQRKFDRGATDILEMLNTQSALLDAQQERIRCLSEWRSARLRLLASAGVLGMGDIAGNGVVDKEKVMPGR
jgi:outer membrane protein